MKKIIQTKNNIIIIALCFTIIFMSLGYIILFSRKDTEEYSYNVVFSQVTKSTTLKGSEKTPISSYKIINNNEILFKYTLYYPYDEIAYVVHIENKGTIPCEIVDIMESPDYSSAQLKNMISPVSIKLSNIKGKIIPPNEAIDLKVSVTYNPTSKEIITRNFDYKIGLITRSR